MSGRIFPSWSHLGPCLKRVILYISLLEVGQGEGGWVPSIQYADFSLMPLFPILSLNSSPKPKVLGVPSLDPLSSVYPEQTSHFCGGAGHSDCRLVAGLWGGRQNSRTLTFVILCLILASCGTLWLHDTSSGEREGVSLQMSLNNHVLRT